MTETSESELKDKGGAPLGNTNALKHGFYARSFRRSESKKLETDLVGQCQDEIALLRILILRTAQAVKDKPNLSLMEYLTALRGVAQAVSSLASILRAQKVVYGNINSEDSLEAALRDLPIFLDDDYMKYILENPNAPREVLAEKFPREILAKSSPEQVVPPVVPQE